MSIKTSELKVLRSKFLDKCPTIKRLKSEIDILSEKFIKIVESDLSYGLSETEYKVLSSLPTFFTKCRITLGNHFRSIYYPPKGNINPTTYSVTKIIFIPVTYPNMNDEGIWNIIPDFKRSGILRKLIPVNNEIISLDSQILEIRDNFSRFINENTSLVWLKENLPGVYNVLKNECI